MGAQGNKNHDLPATHVTRRTFAPSRSSWRRPLPYLSATPTSAGSGRARCSGWRRRPWSF